MFLLIATLIVLAGLGWGLLCQHLTQRFFPESE